MTLKAVRRYVVIWFSVPIALDEAEPASVGLSSEVDEVGRGIVQGGYLVLQNDGLTVLLVIDHVLEGSGSPSRAGVAYAGRTR